jgi:hypothetical protein
VGAFAAKPKPTTPATSGYFGVPYLDHGAVCDGRQDTAGGCFLSDAGRARVLGDFRSLCDKAGENYKFAVAELKTEILIQKEDELPWFVSLAIEAIATHVASTLVKGLSAARAAGAAKLQAMNLLGGERGDFNPGSWAVRAETALSHVTPEQMKSLVNAGAKTAKGSASKAIQGHVNEEALGEKFGSISYLDSLMDGCDATFRDFALNVSATSNDAEIVAAWQGVQPHLHTRAVYKAQIHDKLAGFKVSGVNQIGHRYEGHDGGKNVNTRVVLVRDIHGNTRPWYQVSEQSLVASPYPGAGPGYTDPRLDKPVPADFASVAIERQIATWGAIETIDDGFVAQLKATGQDIPDVARRLEHKPTAQESAAKQAFGHYADPPLTQPATQPPLPDGSIFDPLFMLRSKP